MAGENCLLSIEGYGERRVKAIRVSHGISIINFGNDESKSRRGKHFLTYRRTSGSFDLRLIFSTYDEYADLMDWLKRYVIRNQSQHRAPKPVRVIIPARNFDKIGTLEGGLTFGDKALGVTYSVDLKFMGSSDPLDLKDDKILSIFELPKDTSDPALPYLYPAGSQLTGVEVGDDVGDFDQEYIFPGEFGGGGGFDEGGAGGSGF